MFTSSDPVSVLLCTLLANQNRKDDCNAKIYLLKQFLKGANTNVEHYFILGFKKCEQTALCSLPLFAAECVEFLLGNQKLCVIVLSGV